MALSGGSQGGEFTSAFGGVAEVHGRTASAAFGGDAFAERATGRLQQSSHSGPLAPARRWNTALLQARCNGPQ
jgi:hypothetical protein